MNPFDLYRRVALIDDEATQEEISLRLNVRQWTISRIMPLFNLDEELVFLLDGEGRASLPALTLLASYPKKDQRSALPYIRKILIRKKGKKLRRSDIEGLMVRRTRILDKAPFPTRACNKCLKRTGAQMDFDLFDGEGLQGLGRCLDAACFSRCVNAVAARRARWTEGKRRKKPQGA